MTMAGEVEVMEENNCLHFVIKTQEAGMLIGEGGQRLLALNHLIKRMVESELKRNNLGYVRFFLDVNDYRAKRVEGLKNLAKMSVQRVRFYKRDLEMGPMSSYERMIVHSALAEFPDIKTESIGEGENRRVVVKFSEI